MDNIVPVAFGGSSQTSIIDNETDAEEYAKMFGGYEDNDDTSLELTDIYE